MIPFDASGYTDLGAHDVEPARAQTDLVRPFVDREVSLVMRGMVLVRATFAPALLVVAAAVIWVDPSPWRRAAIGVTAVAAVLLARVAVARMERRGVDARMMAINLVAMAVVQATVVTLTGGIDSPLLPLLGPLAVVGAMLGGRSRATTLLLGTQLAWVCALGIAASVGAFPELAMPALFGHPAPVRAPLGYLTQTAVIAAMIVGSGALGLQVRLRIEAMIMRALAARDDELKAWATHSCEVEALSAEIAHELKNPLASVKGLAALVARDLPTGRAHERMGVLRAEVDRMAGILDAFLNFSRPVTPLAEGPVDLMRVARHVAEMHEASVRSRDLTLTVTGESARVSGDQRKVIQVLINLVQNAIDATAAGSEVEIAVLTEPGRGVIEVRDRGVGVPPDALERWMQPGVTTKPHGSGLGLPIARSLVDQHRGRLTLQARPGGGAVARVELPAEPALRGAA